MSVERLEAIRNGTVAGQPDTVLLLVREALADGVPSGVLLQDGLIAAMDEVGRRFEQGDCYIPEMLLSARVMKAAVEVLRPHLLEVQVEPLGRIVIGTMEGDLHDIGKNLVGIMLEGVGFEVIDLGSNVRRARFVGAVQKHQPGFVGFSTCSTTMPNMAHVAASARRGSGGPRDRRAPVTARRRDRRGLLRRHRHRGCPVAAEPPEPEVADERDRGMAGRPESGAPASRQR